MTSNKTTESLNLYPMNSDNYTAAFAGVTNSDIDKRTVMDLGEVYKSNGDARDGDDRDSLDSHLAGTDREKNAINNSNLGDNSKTDSMDKSQDENSYHTSKKDEQDGDANDENTGNDNNAVNTDVKVGTTQHTQSAPNTDTECARQGCTPYPYRDFQQVLSEEDIIPPYDSAMCKNNSLINHDTVILANNANNSNLPTTATASDSDSKDNGTCRNEDGGNMDSTKKSEGNGSAQCLLRPDTDDDNSKSAQDSRFQFSETAAAVIDTGEAAVEFNSANEETRQVSDSSSELSEGRELASNGIIDNSLQERLIDEQVSEKTSTREQDHNIEKQREEKMPVVMATKPAHLHPKQEQNPDQEFVQNTQLGSDTLSNQSLSEHNDKTQDFEISTNKAQTGRIGQDKLPSNPKPTQSSSTYSYGLNNLTLSKDQRQLFEQKMEQKKMEQFRKLNQLPNNDSKRFAKSMSPMSPRTTSSFSQKVPMVDHTQAPEKSAFSNSSFSKTSFNNNNNNNNSNLNGGIANPNTSLLKSNGTHKTNSSSAFVNKTVPNTRSTNALNNHMNGVSSLQNDGVDKSDQYKNSTPNSNYTPVPAATFSSNYNANPQTAFSPPKRSVSPFRDPSNLYLKQINDQQRPLYTPAVLRVMRDNPIQASSVESGFDVYTAPSNRPQLSQSVSTASIRSTASSIMEYWNNFTGGNKQQIPGPTRKHWKPDSTRFNCAQCGKIFNYLTDSRRKHHCRSCGDIFCGDCLKNYIYLDSDAKFTLFGSNWDDDATTVEESSHPMHRSECDLISDGLNKDAISSDTRKQNLREGDDSKYLCKVCLRCFQKYEEYVLDHTTRDHNLGTDGKDIRKSNNEHKDTTMDRQNIPVDWDWSSF